MIGKGINCNAKKHELENYFRYVFSTTAQPVLLPMAGELCAEPEQSFGWSLLDYTALRVQRSDAHKTHLGGRQGVQTLPRAKLLGPLQRSMRQTCPLSSLEPVILPAPWGGWFLRGEGTQGSLCCVCAKHQHTAWTHISPNWLIFRTRWTMPRNACTLPHGIAINSQQLFRSRTSPPPPNPHACIAWEWASISTPCPQNNQLLPSLLPSYETFLTG